MNHNSIEMASYYQHRYRRRNLQSGYTNNKIANVVKAALVFILVINTKMTDASELSNKDDIAKRMKIVEKVSGRFFNDIYSNGTFRTGNHLWDNILNQCSGKPSVSCLQKNVYSYLNEKLDLEGDVKVTSGMCFKKNNVDINKYTREANIIYLTGSKDKESERYLDEDNEIADEDDAESPIDEVTDALYDKGVKFLTTHDMKLTLPEIFFDGAILKVSPRALTKTGALVHIDLEPKEEPNGQSRLFFHKIKKYIRKKLVTAAIAIILVVKLIALKLIFVLPLILGVTTAKKMFLKLLLFLFPALSHIFKLCSWYHQSYHTTKYHHHHHLITHNHHKVPHQSHHPYGGHSGHGSVVIRPGASAPAPTFEHYPQDWELSGPGLGSEYLASDIHRNAIASFKPNVNDANDINAWGLGMPPGPSMNLGEVGASGSNNLPSASGQKLSVGPAGRPVGPPNPYYRNKKNVPKDPLQAEKEALIRAASIAARAPPSAVRDEILRVSAVKLKENTRVKTETDLVKQQQQIIAASDPETIAAEQFYRAIIEKVDSILTPIGATEPGCKERAICSMYGDPFKHAPYSNLVSNELSKDSNELIPAADSRMALRFYRYVQAARDGQEQKDCLVSYPQCDVNYDHKK